MHYIFITPPEYKGQPILYLKVLLSIKYPVQNKLASVGIVVSTDYPKFPLALINKTLLSVYPALF